MHPLRQITTNPMKKGGYGFNKTTLSERKGYKGVVSFPTAIVYFIILGRDRPIIQGIPQWLPASPAEAKALPREGALALVFPTATSCVLHTYVDAVIELCLHACIQQIYI